MPAHMTTGTLAMRNSGKKTTKSTRPKKATAAKKVVRTRKNMPAAEREKVILESAIRFFAEHGFEGQQRELAKRIGITHSAIYRHFPSKEALVERVYEHVYLGSWQKHWGDLIQDEADRWRPGSINSIPNTSITSSVSTGCASSFLPA